MAAPIRHVCRACPNLPLLFMRSETVSVKSEFTGLSRCRSSVQGCCSVKKLPSNGVNPGATRDNLLGQPPMWCPLMEKYCSLTLVCWSCQTPSPKEKQKTMFFCEHCDSIQPVIDEVNHFERLEFKTSFDVDIDKLTRKYRELQSILHPDKYGTKTLEEQNYSSQQSAAINKLFL
uniref:Uncharacterized protein LOC102801490 n=1 Tax=Saccoglossus kowalevskii TaxID=10224 RepID=A0ABM0MGC5_SACKO|nr:PREDICTED: uncharacterized protein LOC102801490 [Saccoglossus kowalevskii]